ncbi:delta and Notch-like epidermal growth factor-related receptor isoform X2 [Dreissena polymorpha]|uniref:delta and Notch-like epidermal growth factor-related receptor isoform X2 n=1 Tax=Dreissena polymorpha TaxID=45954 RepID=UPI0022646731|nr:delta and Notch-like epidermal growth factor-related receptor isoform X2 [Dreissena polymorpha]
MQVALLFEKEVMQLQTSIVYAIYVIVFMYGTINSTSTDIYNLNYNNINYNDPDITCGNLTCYGPFTNACNTTLDQPCECLLEFEGESCQFDFNECGPGHRPCGTTGLCVNTIRSFTCICLNGWTGDRCRYRNGDPKECIPGWTGPLCRDDINECESSYSCGCNYGWTGDHCETYIDECIPAFKTCQNGAACQNQPGLYECICPPEWTGKNCSQKNYCNLNPCRHNERCLNGQTSRNCTCLDGWKGENCTDDIDECLQSPCINNGNCTNMNGTFVCACSEDREGHECEIVVHKRARTFSKNWFKNGENMWIIVSSVAGLIIVIVTGLCFCNKCGYNKIRSESSATD